MIQYQNMELPIARLLLAELKVQLRNRKIVYADFARSLAMSESGLKKLLSADDCSLGRIQKMCSTLGLSFFDLVESIEGTRLVETQFTREQESYFEKDRTGFLFYWLLVYERRSLVETSRLLKLDSRKQQSLLLKLDRLALLQVQAGGRFQIPDPLAIRWVGRSPFVLRLYEKWGVSLLRRH